MATGPSECSSRGNRGKNFTLKLDRQICRSWIHAKRQEELGDEGAATDEIRSVPFNVWDTLYEHAIFHDPDFEKRSPDGLRHRLTIIQGRVRKFADCYLVAIREEKDPKTALVKGLQYYKESQKANFQFLSCYLILKQHPKFQDLPEINSNDIPAEANVMMDNEQRGINISKSNSVGISDEADYFITAQNTSESNQKQGRGKNFTIENDVHICLSWVHAKNIEELDCNACGLVPFNFWQTLYHHAVSKNPELKARTVQGVHNRFVKIQRTVEKFFKHYNAVVEHENDPDQALEKAIRRYAEQHREKFRFLECFHIFQKFPNMRKQPNAATISSIKVEQRFSSDEQEASNVSGDNHKSQPFSPEDLAEGTPICSSKRNLHDEAHEKPDKDSTPLSQFIRGKNFSVSEDKVLCQSWVQVKEAESISSEPFDLWQNIYDHAISKDSSFSSRPVTSLRSRMQIIMKSSRQFSACYKNYLIEETQTDTDDNALQEALQLYKFNYKEHFKFLNCWFILRQNSEFKHMTQHTPTVKADVLKPVQNEKALLDRRKGAQKVTVRRDELQALLKAACDIGLEEARSRGEPIESLFYDVLQQMAAYGEFIARKLPMLKHMYDETELHYKCDQLKPYPPEARILWGRRGTSEEEKTNDEDWEQLIQCILDDRKGSSFLSGLETKELIRQAVKRKVESASNIEKGIIFNHIHKDMQAKRLCRRKTVNQLMQDYHRLKEQYLSGSCKSLPPEAANLWVSGKTECTEEEITEPIEHIDFDESNVKKETDVCRICQAELLHDAKDLFFDIYNAQTYADIISETINVKMDSGSLQSKLICGSCSGFIEGLSTFVQQCQNSCTSFKANQEKSLITEITKLEVELFDTNMEYIEEEASNICASNCNEFEDNNGEYVNTMDVDDKAEIFPTYDDDDHSGDNPEADHTIAVTTSVVDDDHPEVEAVQPTAPIDGRSETKPEAAIRKKINYRRYKTTRREHKKQCHVCGIRVLDLNSHIESHGETGYKCQFCDRVCPNRRQLRIHMNRHTKEREFPCRYCDKIFYVWTSRKDHERNMHKKERFQCDVCDTVYKNKSYLQAHKKLVHLGIRNLKCTKCTFSTSIKARLLNHVRSIHTSERPYKCPVCNHQSNSNTGYYIHFQRHKKSGEATSYAIKCAYCEEMFDKDVPLEAHILKAHPNRAVVI